jgi:hypothetical protein
LRSGWGALLEPLAWQGALCHGPAQGNQITLTSAAHQVPGWHGLPDPATSVIRRRGAATSRRVRSSFWMRRVPDAMDDSDCDT